MDESEKPKPMGQVIQIDEARIRDQALSEENSGYSMWSLAFHRRSGKIQRYQRWCNSKLARGQSKKLSSDSALQAALYPRSAKVVGAAGGVMILCHNSAAAHRRALSEENSGYLMWSLTCHRRSGKTPRYQRRRNSNFARGQSNQLPSDSAQSCTKNQTGPLRSGCSTPLAQSAAGRMNETVRAGSLR
jgi:hypothetical protein